MGLPEVVRWLSSGTNASTEAAVPILEALANALQTEVVPLVTACTLVDVMAATACARRTPQRRAGLDTVRVVLERCESPEGAVEHLLGQERWPLLIVRDMEREASKYTAERVAAAQLVHQVLKITPVAIPRVLVKSVVAIASEAADPLRSVAVELLRLAAVEAGLAPLLAQTGAFQALFDVLSDAAMRDHCGGVCMTLMFALADADTRSVVKPTLSLRRLMAPLSSTLGKAAACDNLLPNWEAVRHAVVTCMRTWTGSFLFLSDNQGLPSLVAMLYQPAPHLLHLVILRTLVEVLLPPASAPERDGLLPPAARMFADGYASEDDDAAPSPTKSYWRTQVEAVHGEPWNTPTTALNPSFPGAVTVSRLAATNTALVLACLLEADVLRPLTFLAVGGVPPVVEAAVWTLRTVLHVASHVLPDAHMASILALPDLTQLALQHTTRGAVGTHVALPGDATLRTTMNQQVLAVLQPSKPLPQPPEFHALRRHQLMAMLSSEGVVGPAGGGTLSSDDDSSDGGDDRAPGFAARLVPLRRDSRRASAGLLGTVAAHDIYSHRRSSAVPLGDGIMPPLPHQDSNKLFPGVPRDPPPPTRLGPRRVPSVVGARSLSAACDVRAAAPSVHTAKWWLREVAHAAAMEVQLPAVPKLGSIGGVGPAVQPGSVVRFSDASALPLGIAVRDNFLLGLNPVTSHHTASLQPGWSPTAAASSPPGGDAAQAHPLDTGYSVGLVRRGDVPGVARRAATLANLLTSWTAAADGKQDVAPSTGVTAAAHLLASLASLHAPVGDHERNSRHVFVQSAFLDSDDSDTASDEGTDSAGSGSESDGGFAATPLLLSPRRLTLRRSTTTSSRASDDSAWAMLDSPSMRSPLHTLGSSREPSPVPVSKETSPGAAPPPLPPPPPPLPGPARERAGTDPYAGSHSMPSTPRRSGFRSMLRSIFKRNSAASLDSDMESDAEAGDLGSPLPPPPPPRAPDAFSRPDEGAPVDDTPADAAELGSSAGSSVLDPMEARDQPGELPRRRSSSVSRLQGVGAPPIPQRVSRSQSTTALNSSGRVSAPAAPPVRVRSESAHVKPASAPSVAPVLPPLDTLPDAEPGPQSYRPALVADSSGALVLDDGTTDGATHADGELVVPPSVRVWQPASMAPRAAAGTGKFVWELRPTMWELHDPAAATLAVTVPHPLPVRRALGMALWRNMRRSEVEPPRDGWLAGLLRVTHVNTNPDWRAWNWGLVAWLLDGPLTNPSYLSDALTTPFMQNIGTAFLLPVDKADPTFATGGMAALPWVPAALRYFRVARQWLILLLHHRSGRACPTLMVFVTRLVAAVRVAIARGSRSLSKSVPRSYVDLFQRTPVETAVVREYLALFGLLTSCYQGRAILAQVGSSSSATVCTAAGSESGNRHLRPAASFTGVTLPTFALTVDLDDADVVLSFSLMAASSGQDYLSRALLTSLSYAEDPSSRRLLHTWATSPATSPAVRVFAASVVRGLLRLGATGASEWAVDVLVDMLAAQEDAVASAALSAITEACAHVVYASAVVARLDMHAGGGGEDQRRPTLTRFSTAALAPLVVRLCATPSGLTHLEASGLLAASLRDWLHSANVQYAAHVEARLSAGMVASADVAAGAGAAVGPTPVTVNLPGDVTASQLDAHRYSLHTALRLPWRVEVWEDWDTEAAPSGTFVNVSVKASKMLGLNKARRTSATVGNSDGGKGVVVDGKSRHTSRLVCDTWLDLTSYRPEFSAGGDGRVRVRAVVLNSAGNPKPATLHPQAKVRAALYLGAHPVAPDGNVPMCGTPHRPEWSSTEAPAAPGVFAARTTSAESHAPSVVGEEDAVSSMDAATSALRKDAVAAAAALVSGAAATAGPLKRFTDTLGWSKDMGLMPADAASSSSAAAMLDPKDAHARTQQWATRATDWSVVDASNVFPVPDAEVEADAEGDVSDGEEAVVKDIPKAVAPVGAVRHSGGTAASLKSKPKPNRPIARPPSSRTKVLCEPGSHAEWHFSESVLSPGSVRLEAVEFLLDLRPTAPAQDPVPPHLYGTMGRTSVGIEALKRDGAVGALLEAMQDPAVPSLERRGAMWAVAHLAGNDRGYAFVLELLPGFPAVMDALARTCDNLALRGVAMSCIQLVACSTQGRADLEALGWSMSTSRVPIVVPERGADVMHVPGNVFDPEMPPDNTPVLPPDVPEAAKVVECMSKLCSRITEPEARRALMKMKSTTPKPFESIALYRTVVRMVATLNYNLRLRRLVHALFEGLPFGDASVWAT